MNVADQRSPRPLTRRFLEAAQAAGIPANPDLNSPEQDGVGMTVVFQRNGRRWSTADGYLRPAMKRPNLTVKPKAHVLGLVFDGERAVGVRWRDSRGHIHSSEAKRDVVLSAGAIGSPQLLMLAGIGPAEHLRSIGVEPRVDLAGVGEQPSGPPVLPALLRVDRAREPRRRREAQGAAGVHPAPHRPAVLERRRGDGVHPHPARASGRRRPAPLRARLLPRSWVRLHRRPRVSRSRRRC